MATKRRKQPPTARAVPPRVIEIAEDLRKLPGVVCVVWGIRRKGKAWYRRQPCISVHVRKKHAPEKLGARALPREIDGYLIDVLEVGKPKLHTLDVQSRIDAGPLGRSTATVIATRGSDAVALVSGHGTLDGTGGQVKVNVGGQTFSGAVGPGGFGQGLSVDFALATFAGAAQDADTAHPALDGSAPFRLTRRLEPGSKVRHFSVKRGASIPGVFFGEVIGSVELEGETYTSLLSIASPLNGEPFSVPGDSGSLIAAEDGNAAAAVVGGRPDLHVFYAYDLRRLSSALSKARFALFFEED